MNKEEKILEYVDNLIEENNDLPIIVEGKKDEIALRRLGAKGDILRLNRGMTLTEFCDFIIKKYKKVILLLDWDKKGNLLLNQIEAILKSNGIDCDVTFRRKIISLVGNSIRSVEEIYYLYVLSYQELNFHLPKNRTKFRKR